MNELKMQSKIPVDHLIYLCFDCCSLLFNTGYRYISKIMLSAKHTETQRPKVKVQDLRGKCLEKAFENIVSFNQLHFQPIVIYNIPYKGTFIIIKDGSEQNDQTEVKRHTLANRSSLIHGTKYFQGHMSNVLTARDFVNTRFAINFAEVKFGCTRNLAATSTENSYVLNTRSTGFLSIVTTEVLSLGSLEVKL
jgi:hypothetical protein